MRKITRIIFLSFLSISTCLVVKAQDDKALKKEWSKKLKATDPLDFKRLVEGNESMKADIAAKNNTVSDLQNSVAQKDEELRKANEELTKMREEYGNYKSSVQTATTPASNETDATLTQEKKEKLYKGVVFKVQIGAFKNKDLKKYFENNKNFSGEEDPDGIKKYTLGYFNDYWEAENFKKYLREMGVKDAWIVPYKNGKRVNIRDVLEGLI